MDSAIENFATDKWYHVFTAGNLPQLRNGKIVYVEVTEEMLAEVAANYDLTFRQACVWIGHPGSAPALAWIGAVKAEGKKLYVKFSFVSQDLKKLTDEKKYKFVSAELHKVERDGVELLYLRAVGMTNVPLISALNEMSFSQQKPPAGVILCENVPAFDFSGHTENKSKSQNNNNSLSNKLKQMEDFIKLFAERFGISISNHNLKTDEDVINYVAEHLTKLQSKYSGGDSESVTSLDVCVSKACSTFDEAIDLKKQLVKAEDDKVDSLLASAVQLGKVMPAEVEDLKLLAASSFGVVRKMIEGRPVNPALAQSVVSASEQDTPELTPGDKTPEGYLKKDDGSAYTFADIVEDATLAEKMPQSQLDELEKAHEHNHTIQ